MRSSKPSVVLVGHGSKAADFDVAMRKVASALEESGRWREVACAFLEVSEPSIPDAIDACVASGATEVRILPYFVLTGKHVMRDIPQIVKTSVENHEGRAKIILCPYLGFDERVVSLVEKRLDEHA